MNTPIYDFVKKYAEGNTVRGHMPGHKGKAPYPCGFEDAFLYDITEIKDADALFEAEGIIAESEKNASRLFGTKETVYSCAGSTGCIQAMLAAVCGKGSNIIAARNAHRAFINTCALLGLNVKWIFPRNTDTAVSGEIAPEDVEAALKSFPARAVYITSPDYLGHISDIRAISEVCRKHGAYLICDNAHGAYTAFLEPSMHPIALGADICCDSAHKTLPVLTGGAYLHVGNTALTGRVKECMSLFCSSSPSYLILQSLDLCNRYLAERFPDDLKRTVSKISEMKSELSPIYEFCGEEPLKLTIHSAACGMDGSGLAEYLRENGIECEYADSSYAVMMLSPFNSDGDLERISSALKTVKMPRILMRSTPIVFPEPKQMMPIREAMFSPCRYVPVSEAVGKICGRTVSACPPGIAAAVPGELITEEYAELFKTLGIARVNVICEQNLQ
ncbi:MAG: aminotransferase class I/II-fold pyridoxal phosphate-dependent enzyme [Oscillospiraceae bacterium]